MFRVITSAALALFVLGGGSVAAQESGSEVPEEQQAKKLPRQSLNGPRFGFTMFTGEVAEQRNQADLAPAISQFGWQFETQMVSLEGGHKALLELVTLLGGVESEHPTISAALMAGYRLANGFELGAGPNISYTTQTDKATTSMVIAAGATLPFGDIWVPLNTAVSLAEGGPRITVLTGWIIG